MTGIEAIAAERKRQIESEGWTPEHDDEHADGSLVDAAVSYAGHAKAGTVLNAPLDMYRIAPVTVVAWPESWCTSWWKPKNPRRDLVRAGALIAAEIDRLDRLEARQKGGA